MTQAHTLLAHGDLDGASSTLDRALRIEPNNPLLWVELGRLRLAENDAHQAEGCGRKALALASGDRTAQNQAGHLPPMRCARSNVIKKRMTWRASSRAERGRPRRHSRCVRFRTHRRDFLTR